MQWLKKIWVWLRYKLIKVEKTEPKKPESSSCFSDNNARLHLSYTIYEADGSVKEKVNVVYPLTTDKENK